MCVSVAILGSLFLIPAIFCAIFTVGLGNERGKCDKPGSQATRRRSGLNIRQGYVNMQIHAQAIVGGFIIIDKQTDKDIEDTLRDWCTRKRKENNINLYNLILSSHLDFAQVIHEQQLGLHWKPPADDALHSKRTAPPSVLVLSYSSSKPPVSNPQH